MTYTSSGKEKNMSHKKIDTYSNKNSLIFNH